LGYLKLRMTVTDELIERNHKYQTYIRRCIEVTPARHDLCFAPTQDVWKLMLCQEESIDRQIERKTRLLWAMQGRTGSGERTRSGRRSSRKRRRPAESRRGTRMPNWPKKWTTRW